MGGDINDVDECFNNTLFNIPFNTFPAIPIRGPVPVLPLTSVEVDRSLFTPPTSSSLNRNVHSSVNFQYSK